VPVLAPFGDSPRTRTHAQTTHTLTLRSKFPPTLDAPASQTSCSPTSALARPRVCPCPASPQHSRLLRRRCCRLPYPRSTWRAPATRWAHLSSRHSLLTMCSCRPACCPACRATKTSSVLCCTHSFSFGVWSSNVEAVSKSVRRLWTRVCPSAHALAAICSGVCDSLEVSN